MAKTKAAYRTLTTVEQADLRRVVTECTTRWHPRTCQHVAPVHIACAYIERGCVHFVTECPSCGDAWQYTRALGAFDKT